MGLTKEQEEEILKEVNSVQNRGLKVAMDLVQSLMADENLSKDIDIMDIINGLVRLLILNNKDSIENEVENNIKMKELYLETAENLYNKSAEARIHETDLAIVYMKALTDIITQYRVMQKYYKDNITE